MPSKRRATTQGEKLSTADTEPLPADLITPPEVLQDTKPIRRAMVRARMRRLAAGTSAPTPAYVASRADTEEDNGSDFE